MDCDNEVKMETETPDFDTGRWPHRKPIIEDCELNFRMVLIKIQREQIGLCSEAAWPG